MKMTIAFKEAKETLYWLRLLKDSKIVDYDYSICLRDAEEIIRILTAITHKTKLTKGSSAVNNSSLLTSNS